MCGRKVYPIRTSLIRIKVTCIGTRSNVDTPIVTCVMANNKGPNCTIPHH